MRLWCSPFGFLNFLPAHESLGVRFSSTAPRERAKVISRKPSRRNAAGHSFPSAVRISPRNGLGRVKNSSGSCLRWHERRAERMTVNSRLFLLTRLTPCVEHEGRGESEATRRMKTEFLVQMQGVGETNHQEGEENEEKTSHPHVLVLAATNLPWALDNAVRRRFERRVYIPLPDASSRAQMIRTHLGTTPHSLHETELTDLSTRLSFYSGSDINVLVRNAMMESIRHAQKATHFKKVSGPHPRVPTLQCEDLLTPCRVGEEAMGVPMRLSEVPDPTKVVPPKVSWGDFVQSLRTARPSVCEADVHRHLEFTQKFGQEG